MDSPLQYGSAEPGGGTALHGQRYGQAAMLLVESLMHALLEKGVISKDDFIETVEGAAEVEIELHLANASPPADSDGSLLQPLADAFRRERGQ